jgi:prepilin-type N-terminal cleavage/methylation domain-containing protein
MSELSKPKPSPTEAASRPDSGFSLIELMVALVVTLIVSGAVYGLLTSGSSAFRKEPAMADRQANIRAAMDMIVSDLRGAGAGMPPFTRVFTPSLDGFPGGPNSPVGGVTDQLEFVTETSARTGQLVCAYSGTTVDLPEPNTPINAGDSFGIFLPNGQWTVRVATAVVPTAAASGACTNSHTQIAFAAAAPWTLVNVAGGLCAAGSIGNTGGVACPAVPPSQVMFSFARAVAYRINYDAFGVPFLERRTSDTGWAWQQVLPGIEDLQVRYQDGNGGPPPTFKTVPATLTVAAPTSPTAVELNSMVRQVEVTLGARALGPLLTGQQTAAGGLANAPRGRLVSVTAMRPVFETLSQPGPSPLPMYR